VGFFLGSTLAFVDFCRLIGTRSTAIPRAA